jgi:hypothetical protein
MARSDAPEDKQPTPAAEDLDALNKRIAEEAAAATTADKVNPKKS